MQKEILIWTLFSSTNFLVPDPPPPPLFEYVPGVPPSATATPWGWALNTEALVHVLGHGPRRRIRPCPCPCIGMPCPGAAPLSGSAGARAL